MSPTGRFFTAGEAPAANLTNRVAPTGQVMEATTRLAQEVAFRCATARARRWFLDRCAKEAGFHRAPMRLHLTEDFHEAALTFKEGASRKRSRAASASRFDEPPWWTI